MPRFVFVATTRRVASTASSTAAPTPIVPARSSGPAIAAALEEEVEVSGVVEVAARDGRCPASAP